MSDAPEQEYLPAVRAAEVAPGGIVAVTLYPPSAPGGAGRTVGARGVEVIICNCGGVYYALDRRCGHRNAPLEKGTLDGRILTCAAHCAQFDVTTGEALSNPVPLFRTAADERPTATESIRTWPVRLEDGWVFVAARRREPKP